MFIHSGHRSGSPGTRRFPYLVCLAILLLIAHTGIASAGSNTSTAATTTTTATTTAAATTTTSGSPGGSIYFETSPPGATVWLDNVEIGTSVFTYYTEKKGRLDVLIRKKGYEDYRGTVIVIGGRRVDFYALLTPAPRSLPEEYVPAEPVPAATTIRKSTVTIPTSWPASPPKSPVDPAVVIAAAITGTVFFVIRRR